MKRKRKVGAKGDQFESDLAQRDVPPAGGCIVGWASVPVFPREIASLDTSTPDAAGPSASRVEYIDSLRGLAITGVIASHVGLLFDNLPWRVGRVAGLGANGVHLFFVASALTLLISWSRHQDGTLPFYVRRIFRIAPMFWLAALTYVPLDSVLNAPFWSNGTVSDGNIILTIFFCHGWSPDAINAVVPGGWTIAVEMTFYAIFPLLAAGITTLKRSCAFAIIAMLIAPVANSVAIHLWGNVTPTRELAEFIYYWLPNSLPCFAVGFVTFHLLNKAPRSFPLSTGLLFCAASISLYVAWGNLPFGSSFGRPLSRGTIFSAACLLLVLALHRVPNIILVNRVTRGLGRVSYSAYLVHWLLVEALLLTIGPVHASPLMSSLLWLFAAPVLIAATGAMASVTYRYVEKPMIHLGSRLARKLRAARSVQMTVR